MTNALLTVAEFPYPSANILPHRAAMEIVSQDSRHLLTAMKKQYPNCNFNARVEGKGRDLKLVLEVVNANDFQRIGMTYFAEGFMASAHLWER